MVSDSPPHLSDLTAAEARQALDSREFSALELTEAYLERIEQFDGELGVYLHVMRDVALAQAAAADRRLATGDASPLTGIPWHSKTCSARSTHRQPPDHASSRDFARRTTPPSCGVFASKARCFSAKPTRTSSRWARRTRIPPSNRSGIRGIPSGSPEGAAAGPPRRLPPGSPQ